jgi:hypothetical protein
MMTFVDAIEKKTFCEVEYHRDDIYGMSADVSAVKKTFYFAPLSVSISNDKIYVEGYKGRLSGKTNNLIGFEERTLLLNRVSAATPTDYPRSEKLKPRTQASGAYFGKTLTKEFILEANFAPRLKEYLFERQWPGGAKLQLYQIKEDSRKSVYPGWIKLRMPCGDARETLSWLLGFGSEAVVISPKAFRNKYFAELKKMSEVSRRIAKFKAARKPKPAKASVGESA